MNHPFQIIVFLFILIPTLALAKSTKKKALTLSNGQYEEFFDTDSIEQIGSVLLNVNTKKIVGFAETANEIDTSIAPDLISRWLSLDPLASKYPSINPYTFAANSPIIFIDPDGREIQLWSVTYNNKNKPIVEKVIYKNGQLTTLNGSIYKGTTATILNTAKSLDKLRSNDSRYEGAIRTMEDNKRADGSPIIHTISNILPSFESIGRNGERISNISNGSQVQRTTDKNDNYDGGTITKFVPDLDRATFPNLADNSNEEILIHEIKHVLNRIFGLTVPRNQTSGTPENPGPPCEEVDGVNFQNIQRNIEGKEPRSQYGGKDIPKENLAPVK